MYSTFQIDFGHPHLRRAEPLVDCFCSTPQRGRAIRRFALRQREGRVRRIRISLGKNRDRDQDQPRGRGQQGTIHAPGINANAMFIFCLPFHRKTGFYVFLLLFKTTGGSKVIKFRGWQDRKKS